MSQMQRPSSGCVNCGGEVRTRKPDWGWTCSKCVQMFQVLRRVNFSLAETDREKFLAQKAVNKRGDVVRMADMDAEDLRSCGQRLRAFSGQLNTQGGE